MSPKMRSKIEILANFTPHLHLATAKLQGATCRSKSVPARENLWGMSGEVERSAEKGRQQRSGKGLFFNTTEASILLKTQAKCFENNKNGLASRGNSAPKCTPKSRLLPVRNPLSSPPGQVTWGYTAGRVIEKDVKMMGTNSTNPLLTTKASKKRTLRVGSWKLFPSGTAPWPRNALNVPSVAARGRPRRAWHSGSLSASRAASAHTARLTNECTDARRTNRQWTNET